MPTKPRERGAQGASEEAADPREADDSVESGHCPEPGEQLDFETAIEELEALVDRMETGDLTLEESLAAYERGVKLTRHCQTALRKAELKVNRLTADDRLAPMDPDAVDDD